MEIRKAWKNVPKPVRQVVTLVVGRTEARKADPRKLFKKKPPRENS